MGDDEVLLAIRYFDHANLRDVAATLDVDVGPMFRTCRRLAREDHLEKVRPMTYRITDDGVEHLESRLSSAERTRWNPFHGTEVATGLEDELDPPEDADVVLTTGPVVPGSSRSALDAEPGQSWGLDDESK